MLFPESFSFLCSLCVSLFFAQGCGILYQPNTEPSTAAHTVFLVIYHPQQILVQGIDTLWVSPSQRGSCERETENYLPQGKYPANYPIRSMGGNRDSGKKI